ncbi:SDR family NAD(P)-dependent oxidoreductase [Saccharomonospora xinjiangensis]|uniref:SDR family NAD(P)-dependent oxidoreductase n=1 Tax=Saccharomonospora xinjiangensis TaxID=75294 RepID=UPI00106F580D|nr:SDR family NAD(P)-dependent oxidoreductase [Saccharomonospora xinjiangensis]QBQ60375.1 Phenolphthiocerol synthesis polyketide synthase type I Pks15/1 [Saccharomonospora xinjiangensis]
MTTTTHTPGTQPEHNGAPNGATGNTAEVADRLSVAAEAALAGADPGAGLAVQRGMDALTVLARRMLASALRRMGAFSAPGERARPESLADRLGVVTEHRRLFDTVLGILVTAGMLRRDGGELVADHPLRELGESDVDSMVAGIAGEFGGTGPTARLVRRCLDAYPDVLTGRRGISDVMVADDVIAQQDNRDDTPASPDHGTVTAAVVAEYLRIRMAGAGSASVVELGAGAGGVTTTVLPALAPWGGRVRYLCADSSAEAVEQARQRLGGAGDRVDFAVVDVSAPGPALPQGDTDVLLAANVLHSAGDIDAALAGAAALLRPGGLLVLTEAVSAPEPLVMVLGLSAHWWATGGEGRLPGSPLLSSDQWRAALGRAGFEQVRVHPLPPGVDEDDAPEAVLVAVRAVPAAEPAAKPDSTSASSARTPTAVPTERTTRPTEAARAVTERASGTARPAGPQQPATRARTRPSPSTADTGGPIAIVGLSVRFPGAPDARRYWDLLVSNRVAIGEIPARRWDWREYYTPEPQGMDVVRKSHSRWGGFLDGFDEFDAGFFGMTEQEVRNTDPQQRIFLQECWKALEDAGYSPHGLDPAVRAATGVFAGASKLGFDRLGPDRGVDLPRTSFGDMVNRVSYHLDLGGPSKPVDTACSSALVALHEAVESLRSGECAMALVGGVNLYLHPSTYAELGAVKMLSNLPECPAFGIGGNGIVPGEGVGVVVLKRLADAQRDRDHVRAVVLGSAVNHNGRTVGFTSPNPRRQAEVIGAALRRADVDPATVSYLETTVNGTEIGDAVEMTAVTQVFGGRADAEGEFRIGSVKPNIGHGEASSGMAQLAKVVLALGERTFPPTRVPAEVNPAIDLETLPFELSAEPAPWEPPVVGGQPQPRRAGITGIGAGGVNAHVVVEQAPDSTAEPGTGTALFVLSARTPDRLAASADNWIAYLRANPGLDLVRVAYTSQVGREPMRHRVALVADSVTEIADKLARWRSGDTTVAEVGEAKRPASAVRAERAKGRPLTELARVWAAGGMIAWASLYPQGRPMRLGGLPTYPFESTGYWVDPPAARNGGPTASTVDTLDVGSAVDTGAAEPTPAPAPDARQPERAEPTVNHSGAGSPGEGGYPLLDLAGAVTGADGTVTVAGGVSLSAQPWLRDHLVNGRVLLAGTAIVDLVGRAGEVAGTGRIAELTLHAPLDLTSGTPVALRVVLGPAEPDGTRTVEVTSRPADAVEGRPWSRHATGTCTPLRTEPDFDLSAWPPAGARRLPSEDYYAAMDAAGYTYGPAFTSLKAVWARGDEVFAEVELPESASADATRYGVHPALLDSALHAMGFAPWMNGGGNLLPFAWTGLSVYAPGAGARARARLTKAGASGVALQLADGDGKPVAELQSLVLRSATGERPDLVRDCLYTVDWVPIPEPGTPSAATWSLLGPDHAGFASAVTPAERGTYAVLSLRGPADPPVTTTGLVPAAHEATGALLDTVRDWLADPGNRGRRLVVLTRGAVAAEPGERLTDLVTAPAWGLLRTAQAEHQRRLVLVDLDPHTPVRDLPDLITSAVSADEFHVAVRGGKVLVPRLTRTAATPVLPVPATPAWRLDTTEPGTLDGVALVPAPDALRPLAEGQVRVAVRAAALNFRDVLGALGLYPGEVVLGAEGAGVITEVGPGVGDLTVGQRVFGLLPGGIGPVCVTDARTVRPIPENWSYAEAASAAVAYLTAYHGLVDIAGVRAGESVLVHAAAGGVGSAAVRLARHLGATVFATASPAKHAELRAMGLPPSSIASSRDTGYAESFGGGIDVVLNSLTGDHIDTSLRLLRQGGRFAELGKTDLRTAADVARVRDDVSYRAFDLVEAGPQRIGAMLDVLLPLFRDGTLPPLARTVLDVRRAKDAMRAMSRGEHVGRIVLTMPRTFTPGGTVLVAGGTGTIGSAVARTLVTTHGVRHLLLASRRGEDAPTAAALTAELTALGASVRIARCDMTDRDQVAALLAGIPAEHPLTGVVQLVGALDDGMLGGQTRARLAPVLRAKLDAAVVLHELTRDADPDVFVLFSGAAGVLGNPGQANYAAANAFLDAFARRRRWEGLSGLSVAFGLWASVSDLTRDLDEQAAARMARAGFRMLSDEEGMALFDAAVTGPDDLAVPMKLDIPAMRTGPVHPLMRGLTGEDPVPAREPQPAPATAPAGAPADAAPEALIDRLAAAEPRQRIGVLLAEIASHVAAILPGFEAGDVDADTGFAELGFDSLAAVELRNRLDNATGLRLPVTLVFDQATAGALAHHLLGLLTDRLPATATTSAAGATEAGADSWAGLFAPENLAGVGAVADVGGGGGDDLAALVAGESRAVLHTVPADPAAALPGTYDLVVALGRLAGVRRKRELLARIDAALIDGGRVVVADHVATLRGDLDDRAGGVLVSSVDSWVELLGSARLVVDEVTEPPRLLRTRLDHAALAEAQRRGWARPVLLRLRKDVAMAADERNRVNHRALTDWTGA